MKQDYSGKKVVVIGAGLSGRALVRFLLERNATVVLSDQRSADQIRGLEEFRVPAVRLDLGGHSLALFEQADLVAVSPGVPLDCAPLVRAKSCNVPLLGEVELAAREISAPIIAITGTNGKSTTTCLVGEIFQAWGKKIFVGGNLGTPLVEACATDWDLLAVELSSFQLETIDDFHPRFAMLLNLSADHLDRYADLSSYYHAKLRLFRNLTAADFAILNADDTEVCHLAQGLSATKVWFSAQGQNVRGIIRRGDELIWNWNGADIRLPLASLQLVGEHNIENAMAALAPALLQGCPAGVAWQAVSNFRGLEHRMNLVRQRAGVNWYNDSKGTNVGSVLKSLAGLEPPVTLIAGGKDKGGDYTPLRSILADKVETLILLGEAAQRMAEQLSGSCTIRRAASLESAVAQAADRTAAGGSVLLSPACSSFDMFSDYQARGREFVRLVEALPEAGGDL